MDDALYCIVEGVEVTVGDVVYDNGRRLFKIDSIDPSGKPTGFAVLSGHWLSTCGTVLRITRYSADCHIFGTYRDGEFLLLDREPRAFPPRVTVAEAIDIPINTSSAKWYEELLARNLDIVRKAHQQRD